MSIKSEAPLVSVVVAAYNIEKYIEKCLDSILAQTYENIEILVVDDGSTDKTFSILNVYSKRDRRIKVLHKENGGLVSARKFGNANASGAYILNIDGDDYISNDMVEKLMACALKTDADVVQCGFFDEGAGRTCNYPEYSLQLDSAERKRIFKSWMCGKPYFDSQLVTKLCKASFITAVYNQVPNENSHSEDWLSYAFIVATANKIASIKDVLYYYVCRDASYSHKKFSWKRLLAEDSVLFQISNVIERYCNPEEDLEPFFLKTKLSFLNSYFRGMGKKCPFIVYNYDDVDALAGKRIIIYGAGNVGLNIVKQLSVYQNIDIVGWLDNNYKNINYPFRRVLPVSAITELEFDYVIISILNQSVAFNVKKTLEQEYKILSSKIICDPQKIKRL